MEVSSMTDEERDQIDTDAETYMRTCSVAIQTLKNEGTKIYSLVVIILIEYIFI